MSESGKKLKVVYHEDHSTDVLHTRGEPVVCKDCRHAGWLTQHDFANNKIPSHCLFYSGGADPRDGDRVILDDVTASRESHWGDSLKSLKRWEKSYPHCHKKNTDGQCEDFVRALGTSWLDRFLRRVKRRDMRK